MAIRPVGKAVALSVADTAHAPVTVGADVTDTCAKAAFLNTGATVVSCFATNITPVGNSPAAVQAVDGTPATAGTATIVLPALMTAPIVFVVPTCPFSLSAIGSAAGPSIIFVTPCEE